MNLKFKFNFIKFKFNNLIIKFEIISNNNTSNQYKYKSHESPVLESLFNKVAGQKRLQHRCFPVKLAKFLRTPILKNICGWLLIKWWKKIRFQRTLNKTYSLPHRPSSTEDSSTAKEQKLTKQCFLQHRFSMQSSQYQYWKARKYSILTVIELGPPVSESSTGSQQFMPPLILNTNFRKRESKIGYP